MQQAQVIHDPLVDNQHFVESQLEVDLLFGQYPHVQVLDGPNVGAQLGEVLAELRGNFLRIRPHHLECPADVQLVRSPGAPRADVVRLVLALPAPAEHALHRTAVGVGLENEHQP